MHQQRKVNLILLMLVPLAALILSACDAKLTPQLSHQGRLTDENGDPVSDGDYEVMYQIFDDAVAGTGVYTETQTINVEDGLFTTSLGMTDAMPPTIFAEPVWLQITVDGETLAPRQRLQGAPYAFSLASGAVVQGAESLGEGIFTLSVWNADDTEDGGFGLIAVNNAAAAGADRDGVAALYTVAAGGGVELIPADDRGSYGAIISSNGYRGLLAIGGETQDGLAGYYAAEFDSPAGISIIGGGICSGCTMAYTARNIGTAPISKGDFVVVEGVVEDNDFNIPVMQVRKATAATTAMVGVATGTLSRSPARTVREEAVGEVTVGGYDRGGPTAAQGDYLNVAVQGLVQARAAGGATLQPGSAVSVSAEGVSAATGAGIARAMSEVDANGMVWVLVGSAGGQ